MTSTVPALARLATALALALGSSPAGAGSIPPGFEDIAESRTEPLDVRLYGRSAGPSSVHITLDTVQLEAPEEVLQALGLSIEAQQSLRAALSLALPRNSHLACLHGVPAPGCGYLPPPEDHTSVRALYNENEGTVDLFVSPHWLATEPAHERHHKVSSNAENAFLHQQMFNLSGGRRYRAFTGQGAGVLGLFDHGHLSASWNASQQVYRDRSARELQFDNAYYRHDLGARHYIQGGRMDRRNLSSPLGGTFSFSMLPLDRFQGLRVGTTEAYVDAQTVIQAAPLTVLLARDARVDAFDGDRLLQSFYLQGGINELDTRNFPFGIYNVSLRIYEDGVLVRTEDAPFDKGGGVVDEDLQWFVQGGRRNERYSDPFADQRVMMAGLRVPIGRASALNAGAMQLGGSAFGELRLEWRHTSVTHELRGVFSAMQGSDGSRGQQHQLSFRRRASWNLHQQRMRSVTCHSPRAALDRLGCADALSASVAMPVAGGSAYLAFTRRQTWRPGRDQVGIIDDPLQPLLPPLPPDTFGGVQLSRSWQGSFSRSDYWKTFAVSSRVGVWRQHTDGDLRGQRDHGVYLNLSLSRLQRGDQRSVQTRHGLDLRQPAHARPDASYSISRDLRQTYDAHQRDVSVQLRADNSSRYSASLGAQFQNDMGQSGGVLTRHQQGGRDELTYSATHSSSFAVGSRGLYWSGMYGADAGLAVAVDDSHDLPLTGLAAELQVSGLQRQRLRLGERRLLSLAGYQQHRAEVQDASAWDVPASVRVTGGGAQSFFLAPGRLLHMPIPLEITYTFIGNAQDIAGNPVHGARILNAPVPGTGSNGDFVADFAKRETVLYLLQTHQVLQCPLQVREQRSVVLLVGAVQCVPITVSQLPAAVRSQARVNRLLREQSLIVETAQAAAAGIDR
ncbi:TcfC E-set like domain-containing protein [Stenotrophomonas sp. CFBP 13725]|uniref:TcfC E-set like domain-containing protein n=1 Tax=Stenotrophomonas sp. CFBP 13725 TaxID=2775297 RepID=UPI0017873063|nr:TcfC E-set like domain-containing protein [Stenotrophomonas sp. CFBP 13725]